MSSITIHNLDKKLEILIRNKAKKEGKSLNKTIQELLSESFGINDKFQKHDFSEFCGLWDDDDYNLFKKAVNDFEQINNEDWDE